MTAIATGPDPRQVMREKRVEGTFTPATWLDCLGPLAESDQHSDQIRRVAGIGAIVTLVLAFVTAVAGVALVALCFVIVAAILAVAFFLLRRRDLPNALRLFVVPLLLVLREELSPTQVVTLRLDLTSAQQPQKQLHERKWDTSGRKIVEHLYGHPWLTGETRLVDESRLSWELTDYVRKRDMTRRNARGKIKRKTKYKVKHYLTVRLGLPHDTYAASQAGPTPGKGDRLVVRPGARRDVVQVRRVVVGNNPQTPAELEHFLALVGEAYQRATPTQEAGR